MFRSSRIFMTVLLLFLSLILPHSVRAETITVFAAASLKETLEEIGQLFHAQSGGDVRFSFASSGTLAKQVEAGAPADLFISADLKWMDYLEQKKLIRSETRQNLLGNQLVVVAPQNAPLESLDFTKEAFAKRLDQSRLAIGDVTSVPAGMYAKSAFVKLDLWPLVEPKLAQAENVRAALAFVSRGEVELGVVYRTDALIEKSVKIVAAFPSDSHDPIVYPAALTSLTQSATAQNFLRFLAGPDARIIFEKAGFQVLVP